VQGEEKEKKRRYFKVEKTNTQFNVAPPIKQIVCMSTGEGGETLLKLWSTMRNTHTSP